MSMITHEHFFNKYKNIIERINYINTNCLSNIICIKGLRGKLYITRNELINSNNNCTFGLYGSNNVKGSPIIMDNSYNINIETWYNTHNSFFKKINYNLNNTYFLTATPENENIKKNIIYVNHDISVPVDVFKILNIEKKYKGICTSSSAKFKNIDLLINNPYINIQNTYVPNPNVKNIFLNGIKTKKVDCEKLSIILNQSIFGGCFSEIEGGCFSSAEFLACGLPVLSVKCKGGREVHYNENNSIICENTYNDILNKSKIIYEKCLDKCYDSELIRYEFLKTIDYHKIKFKNILQNILVKINVDIDHEKLINDILKLRYIARTTNIKI